MLHALYISQSKCQHSRAVALFSSTHCTIGFALTLSLSPSPSVSLYINIMYRQHSMCMYNCLTDAMFIYIYSCLYICLYHVHVYVYCLCVPYMFVSAIYYHTCNMYTYICVCADTLYTAWHWYMYKRNPPSGAKPTRSYPNPRLPP